MIFATINNMPFVLEDETVDMNVLPAMLDMAFYIGAWLQEQTDNYPIITSARRTVDGQIKAMQGLKERFGEKYYNNVYKRQGQDPATMPHPEGRAVDFRYNLEGGEPSKELNLKYIKGVGKIIGFIPSRLFVVENNNCFHIQIPRLKDYTKYIEFIRTL